MEEYKKNGDHKGANKRIVEELKQQLREAGGIAPGSLLRLASQITREVRDAEDEESKLKKLLTKAEKEQKGIGEKIENVRVGIDKPRKRQEAGKRKHGKLAGESFAVLTDTGQARAVKGAIGQIRDALLEALQKYLRVLDEHVTQTAPSES